MSQSAGLSAKDLEPQKAACDQDRQASGKARPAARELRIHLPAAPASPLHDDGGEERLLHRPYALDQLRDRDVVGVLDAEHHQPFGREVGEVGLLVKIELLEGLQDVIETAQDLASLLVFAGEHR